MKLKNQLKLYMELRRMNAAQLARAAGVSRQVLSLWLSGAEPRKIAQVKKVAEALGTSLDHLCFGEGAKEETSNKQADLDALFGDGWVGGLFELKLRRVKK